MRPHLPRDPELAEVCFNDQTDMSISPAGGRPLHRTSPHAAEPGRLQFLSAVR